MPAAIIKELTPKMIQACEAYLRGKSMREAMLEAGYSPKYVEGNVAVMRFLKNRLIIEYLRKRKKQHAEVADIDAQYILARLKHIILSDSDKDRTKAVELLIRMTQPMPDRDRLVKEDLRSININITEAKKD